MSLVTNSVIAMACSLAGAIATIIAGCALFTHWHDHSPVPLALLVVAFIFLAVAQGLNTRTFFAIRQHQNKIEAEQAIHKPDCHESD